jgi:hypothetical protein
MTVMSNIPSPTVPADWNTNSYGDAFGPGSSADNAIVRFDGTTGKVVQSSLATIDDNGVIRMAATVGNPIYTRYNQTANSGKVWRAGHTGAVGGFTSYDIYNETDGIVAFTAASTGAVTFPVPTTHIFGANSAGNTVVSARTATGDHAVFETRRNNNIMTAFGIDDSGSYSNATVGSSAFLGTNGETLHFVTGAGFTGSAGNITTGGVWTLGNTAKIGSNDYVGQKLVGKTDGVAIGTGYVGETLLSTYTTPVNYSAPSVWNADASVTLTPGVWLLFGAVLHQNNGATEQAVQMAITSSATAAVSLNETNFCESALPTTTYGITGNVSGLYVSVTANTTYYLNRRAYYTDGTPKHTGALRAVRIA